MDTKKNMDPWQLFESEQIYEKDCAFNSENKLEFEDNFEPPNNDRLPDSEEYLALLGMLYRLFFII